VYHIEMDETKWLWGVEGAINNFVELWCLVTSGDTDIWVSSTSFQKSNMALAASNLKGAKIQLDNSWLWF
jgi:hypothetical protein